MKPHALIRNLLPSLILAAAAANAAVVVSFTEPERYTDVGGWGQDSKPAIEAIERHLQLLGTRYLPPGDTLRIEVVDIDLAGEIRMVGRAMSPVRVVRSAADWPRITLRYTLESRGLTSDRREETLTYSEGLASGKRDEPLHHEKRMLDAWFRARFGK